VNYIITVLSSVVSAYYDQDKIIEGAHYWRFIFRFLFLGSIALLTTESILEGAAMTVSNGLLFWVVFDPFLNYLRGKAFFYLGSEATLDKIGNKYFTPEIFFILKVILLIIVNLILWLKLS